MKYIFFLIFFLGTIKYQGQPNVSNDPTAKIKAYFIYNFTKLFEWNSVNKSSEFRIGLLGDNKSLKLELEKVALVKKVMNLPIKIILFNSIDEITYTEMLYVDFEKFPNYKIKKLKNSLVITENNPDLSNTMIAFITEEYKRVFAINEINIKNSGLIMNSVVKELAAHVITGIDKKLDEVKAKEWRNVFEKFADAINNNSSEITLTKKEAEEVMNTMHDQTQTINDKEQTLKEQEEKISKQIAVLAHQQKDIDQQNKKLITQLDKINSQNTILYLTGFIVLVIGIALLIAYKSVKSKQKANLLLHNQNTEIENQKNEIVEKQKEILDSINYAKRIQYSLLASDELLKANLPQHFLFFSPKDIVSGDFYWGSKIVSSSGADNFILVTADSTGHGVPGAIMSILNISCINESINADKLKQPADILNATREKIIEHLSNDGSEEGGKDGMDCSVISFDFKNKKLIYAAANNPIWIVRDKSFIVLKGDRMPVGRHTKENIPFIQYEFDLQSSDMIYTLTDGFADQFGGPKGKKFMYKQLENLLVSISNKSMNEQKTILHEAFHKWKGDLEQIDDVCLIGVKI